MWIILGRHFSFEKKKKSTPVVLKKIREIFEVGCEIGACMGCP